MELKFSKNSGKDSISNFFLIPNTSQINEKEINKVLCEIERGLGINTTA